MDFRQVLPAGTELDGKYLIERVIGAGGFGITYAAHDIGLNTTIALKEYYPGEFGTRDHTMSVKPKSEEDRDLFDRLRQSFVREARTLAQFKHPSIVRVLSVFESHGTAYMVMEYEEGQSLKAWLQTLGRQPSQAELDRVVGPLLEALDVLHQANFLHRDIAPDNIILRPDGSPVLLDFGAARRVMTQATNSMTGIIKQGYSPQEQYATEGKLQGPWTDIYALGATLYHAVTGAAPQEAMARTLEDQLVPAAQAARGSYRQPFLAGIDAALAIRPTDRPQSIRDLRDIMMGDGTRPTNAPNWQRARTEVIGIPGMAARDPLTVPPAQQPVHGSQPYVPSAGPPVSIPQPGGSRSNLVGAGIVGALVMVGLFGAYQLGKSRPLDTVASTTRPDTPAKPSDDPKRDRILEEAKRRADQVERDRVAREKQEADRLRREQQDRERIDTTRQAGADPDYQQALNFLNGTGGVTRDYARAKTLLEASAARGNRDAMNWVGWIHFHGRGVPQDYVQARQWYERAAALGQATSLNQLGWLYQNGLGVPQDLPRSKDWYEKGANAGSPVAMYNLGSAYQYGRGTPVDYARAREWYEKAAALGDNSAMSQMGWLFQHGLGVTVDYQKAREWYEKAANAGSPSGMNQLGWLYQNALGVPRDYQKAREWYERGATAGNGSSMNQLGWIYQNGLGVAVDLPKSVEWYEKAANTGNVTGMYNYGYALQTGRGVRVDFAAARSWYERAAAQGDASAMNQLGWLFQNALGVPRDYVLAREWYEKGANAGSATSMNQLGWFYQHGNGVPQDYAIAKQWYEKAAAKGSGAGMNQLGWLYANGLGVRKDLAVARQWYEKASAAGKDSGMWNLALQLDSGTGGPVNYARAAFMLLRAVRVNHETTLKELAGSMSGWNRQTRIELKRELQRLGHYSGGLDDTWNETARQAVVTLRQSANR